MEAGNEITARLLEWCGEGGSVHLGPDIGPEIADSLRAAGLEVGADGGDAAAAVLGLEWPPRPLIESALEVMRPDGLLVLVAPNAASIGRRLAVGRGRGPHPRLPAAPSRAIAPGEIEELASHAGLEVAALDGAGGRGLSRRLPRYAPTLVASMCRPEAACHARLPVPAENIYGHRARLDWVAATTSSDQVVVELGCGTGYMVTLQLRRMGYANAIGIDLDERSVEFGRGLARRAGIAEDALRVGGLEQVEEKIDAVVATEVLEHLEDEDLAAVLRDCHARLGSEGRLLVTTPNGYGLFEAEAALWRLIGPLILRTRLYRLLELPRRVLTGDRKTSPAPSTLADSPHVRRFTMRSLRRTLTDHGYEVESIEPSVMFAGPLTNLLFSGIGPIQRLNAWLARRLPRVAVGWRVVARPR